jgi:hypothetical protein
MADIPRMISYQGTANDATGGPVPDGDYQVRFYIYDHPVTGTALWLEMLFTVHTTNGAFSHLIGSINPLPDSIFTKYDSLYLAIMFNYEWQSPRTPLVSNGYSFRVSSLDQATGGSITGSLTFYDSLYTRPYAKIKEDEDGAGMFAIMRPGGFETAFSVLGNSGGETYLMAYGDTKSLVFNSNGQLSAALMLPYNSVDANEIYNEPGVTRGLYQAGTYPLQLGEGEFIEITNTSITIPAPGYILLFAMAHLYSIPVTGYVNHAQLIIRDNSGAQSNGSFVEVDLPNRYCVLNTDHVCYKATGNTTYSFSLMGRDDFTAWPGTTNAITASLIAIYIPTAYGSVTSLVSGEEVGTFEQSQAVTVNDNQKYLVDLRELELRVARAEAELEKSKLELLKAQINEEHSQDNQR